MSASMNQHPIRLPHPAKLINATASLKKTILLYLFSDQVFTLTKTM